MEKYPHESDDNVPNEVLIGEVKHTDQESYAHQGLRELLEYMAFMKTEKKGYFVNPEDVYNTPEIQGRLFVDDIEGCEIDVRDEQLNIQRRNEEYHE